MLFEFAEAVILEDAFPVPFDVIECVFAFYELEQEPVGGGHPGE